MTTATPARAGFTSWKRFPANPDDWFSAEDIAKAKAYSTPSRRLNGVARAVALVADVLVVVTHAAPRLLDALDVHNWVLQVIAVVALTTIVDTVVSTPFGAYRALDFDKRWGFSTQSTSSFVSDTLKGLAVGFVIGSVLTLALWWAIRATSLWWILGFLIVFVFTVVIGVLGPVLIAPLFNKFEPLGDEELRAELLAMAEGLDCSVSEVLVSDASKRDTRDNAYVTGMGVTKRVVLFDTILKRPRAQLRSVVAHELGHYKLRHIPRFVAFLTPAMLLQFALLKVLLEWRWLLDIAGVRSLRSPGAIPLFFLVFGLISRGAAFLPAWVSRWHERQADIFALDSTADPASFIESMRALHTDNLADLTPSRWQRLVRSHPTADERMAMGAEWAKRAGVS
jgi:STE24 endopeptidase